MVRLNRVMSSWVVGTVLAIAISGSLSSGSAAAADTGGPTLDVHPGLRFVEGAQLSGTGPNATVRVRVTWTRADSSGICRQRLRVTDLVTSEVRHLTVTRGAHHRGLDFVVDRAYRVRVTVTDCAGNSTRQAGRYVAQLFQENTAYLDADVEWTSLARSTASGGTLIKGSLGTQAVMFGAGRSIALIAATAPGRGTAEIASRNTYGEVDLDAPRRPRVVVYQDRWLELTDYDNVLMEVLPNGPFVIDAYLIG
jgi:hypothetical protein